MKFLIFFKNNRMPISVALIKKIIAKDFSNMDLSNMDLSKFPEEYWKDAIFKNTNLKNSKINFNPKYLKIKVLENINFENVDLSNLKSTDFSNITIENCNLYNTGLKINFNYMKLPSETMYNVKLDKGIILKNDTLVDIDTLDLNTDYPFGDQQVLLAIMKYIREKQSCAFLFPIVKETRNAEKIYKIFDMTEIEYHAKVYNYINITIDYLKKYKKNDLANLIQKMTESMEIDDVFTFLYSNNNEIDLFFKNIDFTRKEIDIIRNWKICTNRIITFERCSFDVDYKTAQELFTRQIYNSNHSNILNKTNYNNCSFSNNSYSNDGVKKIGSTSFSTNTSVYIKLGNKCNGMCNFCKNKSEIPVQTNVKNIKNALSNENILAHLNEIYFGGGEPSLYLNEIYNILSNYYNTLSNYYKTIGQYNFQIPDWYMFTNGAGNWKQIRNIINKIAEGYKAHSHIIISRQEIEDKQNEKIIGLNYSLDDQNLKYLIYNNKVLFALTCSEMNMRENFLKEYFEFGNDLGIKNFIIQNLETKTGIEVPNIEEYFKEFEIYLKEHNFKSAKIVSSSYFDLSLFKRENYSVALKRYFAPTKLEEHLKYCPKHSFDLGIDSNGEIYNDFQMIKKLKY